MRLPVFRRVVALGVFALLVVGCDELTSTDKRLTKDVSRKISLVFKGLESREYGRSPLIGGDSPEFFVLLPLVGQHPDLPSGDDCTTSGDVQTCGNDTVTFETRSTYQTNDDPSTGFRLEGTRKITLASDPPITQIDSFTEHFTASGANWRIESKHDVALSTSGKRRFRLEWDAREIREQFDADNPDTFVRDVSIEKGSTLTPK